MDFLLCKFQQTTAAVPEDRAAAVLQTTAAVLEDRAAAVPAAVLQTTAAVPENKVFALHCKNSRMVESCVF